MTSDFFIEKILKYFSANLIAKSHLRFKNKPNFNLFRYNLNKYLILFNLNNIFYLKTKIIVSIFTLRGVP